MPHQYWLENCKPKYCGDCETSCKLDEMMVCSPDCEELDSETGEPSESEECHHCDAFTVYQEIMGWDVKRHP